MLWAFSSPGSGPKLTTHRFRPHSVGSNRDTRVTNRKYIYQASSKLELAGKQLRQREDDAGDKQTSRKEKAARSKPDKVTPEKSHYEKPAVEKQKASKKKKKTPESVEAKEKKRSGKRASTALGSPLEVEKTAPKSKKKKSKRASAGDETTPSGGRDPKPAPGGVGGAADKETPGVPPRRKSVRINLKKNLVRRIGEKPFPENVRTPPTSRPRGSALKLGATKRKRKGSTVKRSLNLK